MNNSNAPIASAPRENGSRRAVRRYVIFAVKLKYTRRGYNCTDSTSFASHLTWHLMPLHKSGLLVTLCPHGADAYLPRWQCKWKKTRFDTCTHHYMKRLIYYMMTIARWFILKVAAFLHSSVKAIYFFTYLYAYTHICAYIDSSPWLTSRSWIAKKHDVLRERIYIGTMICIWNG